MFIWKLDINLVGHSHMKICFHWQRTKCICKHDHVYLLCAIIPGIIGICLSFESHSCWYKNNSTIAWFVCCRNIGMRWFFYRNSNTYNQHSKRCTCFTLGTEQISWLSRNGRRGACRRLKIFKQPLQSIGSICTSIRTTICNMQAFQLNIGSNHPNSSFASHGSLLCRCCKFFKLGTTRIMLNSSAVQL